MPLSSAINLRHFSAPTSSCVILSHGSKDLLSCGTCTAKLGRKALSQTYS